jgi:hypothetical protein
MDNSFITENVETFRIFFALSLIHTVPNTQKRRLFHSQAIFTPDWLRLAADTNFN